MNRRSFLKTSAGTTALFLCNLGRSADAKKSPSDAEIMSQCQERIERHRKANATIVIRDADGKALPDASVKLEQLRHEFLFGCNIFPWGRIQEEERERAYRERYTGLLNFATLGFYWWAYEPERGQPGYDHTDDVVAWARQQGITCKGHPLVWDYADPKWLPRDFEEIRALSNGRVREIVARYKGRIDIWDVVNEPTHLGRFNTRMGEWALSLGAAPYVTQHLRIARAANPSATLLVNDYRVDPPFYHILEQLRDEGKLLFDVIGIQSHMHDGVWPLAKVWQVCDLYQKFGVPIHFTETTVVSGRKTLQKWGESTPEGEAKQAEDVAKFYQALFAHPAVQAITWWDFSDHGAWMGAPSGLIRKDMSPKPAYEKLMKLVKGDWWTNASGQSNAQGEYASRAFAGTYRITATTPTGKTAQKEVAIKRGQDNRFELTIA